MALVLALMIVVGRLLYSISLTLPIPSSRVLVIAPVFAYWRDNKFVVAFLLDNEKSAYVPEGRFKIFEGHLKNSLIAILKSERKLRSDDLKITLREEYKSADPNLNLVREDKNL